MPGKSQFLIKMFKKEKVIDTKRISLKKEKEKVYMGKTYMILR